MEKEKLLLHACCAPCSSYVLEFLENTYDITVFYYNPNITDEMEYNKRVAEITRFINTAPFTKNVKFIEGRYDPELFLHISKGLENEPERGKRCYKCYELRLDETARYAKEKGFDLYTTTLSISPHKNAEWLNEIGLRLSEKYEMNYLYSNFKKNNGYSRSIELSKEYNLYRQNFCGCIFSKQESIKREKNKEGY
ncbi:MAG: epoxyqueuosine reductase QueH [Lachnospiraceae bacterium]|nr:epoxyqueuosine reductase QueH [Lachnospiraceae bacterium]